MFNKSVIHWYINQDISRETTIHSKVQGREKMIISCEGIKLENFSNIMLIKVLRTGNILLTIKESIQQVLESYQWDNKC